MKAIIFDLDGVLVDTMPTHYRAMRTALKEITGIDLDKRTFYLLKGMPISQMALKLFKLKDYFTNNRSTGRQQRQLAEQVAHRKQNLVLQTKTIPKPFDGVTELLMNELGSSRQNCLKAVVSGSSKQEIDLIINTYFGSQNFDAVTNGDEFEGKGKPNPAPFLAAVRKLSDVTPIITDVIIVENAPLGVKAARAAKINSIVALNTSPLTISDFNIVEYKDRIFKNTLSAGKFLKQWIGMDKLQLK